MIRVSSSRPIFNFFADLGETIVGPPSADDAGSRTEQKRTHGPVLLLFATSALCFLLVVSLFVEVRNRQQLVESALYSDLSEQLDKVSSASEAGPTRVGRVQSVNFSDSAAIVRTRNNKNFTLRINSKTHIFVYLPSTRRLIPVKPGGGQVTLSPNDLVAFTYNPSTGAALDLVFAPRPPRR